jgi:thymidylate synthase (FAD)
LRIIKSHFNLEKNIDGDKILKRIEEAGRTSYKSEDKITVDSARGFVRALIQKGHESVLEHEKLTARVICDRGVSHEIVRHRIASYTQESTRYCNYSENKFGNEIAFIEPCFWKTGDAKDNIKLEIWKNSMEIVEKSYMDLIRLGATPQEARTVLPNSLKTEIVITMNLREWRHFFRLRTSADAHPQMREIACPMLDQFKKMIPVVFDDISY